VVAPESNGDEWDRVLAINLRGVWSCRNRRGLEQETFTPVLTSHLGFDWREKRNKRGERSNVR